MTIPKLLARELEQVTRKAAGRGLDVAAFCACVCPACGRIRHEATACPRSWAGEAFVTYVPQADGSLIEQIEVYR